MKKLMFFIAVLATVLSSCGGSSSNSTNPIAGTWKLTDFYSKAPTHLEYVYDYPGAPVMNFQNKITSSNANITVKIEDTKITSSGTYTQNHQMTVDNIVMPMQSLPQNYTSSADYVYNSTNQTIQYTNPAGQNNNNGQSFNFINNSGTVNITTLTANRMVWEQPITQTMNYNGLNMTVKGTFVNVFTK